MVDEYLAASNEKIGRRYTTHFVKHVMPDRNTSLFAIPIRLITALLPYLFLNSSVQFSN